MAQQKSRLPLILGLTAAGGVGYYLYAAGGDPKVAEKKFEHDAAAASSKARSSLPGQGKEAQKKGEEMASTVGAKFDSTVNDAKAKLSEADSKASAKMYEADKKIGQLKNDGTAKFDQVRKETENEFHDKIDKFDKTVERKTAEAKSGISSWFGFGK
ncbi:hypothetical protein MMC08_004862 [Hypocenomyce scalaris]|nr:hypothetical protein [Hypocenomyce scalaris]